MHCRHKGQLEGEGSLRSSSCAGNQATIQYKQTMTFFQPLFKSLKRKSVLPEMVAGLDMIVEDIKQRNYLHAYDIYMRLAIGVQPLQPPLTSHIDVAVSAHCCWKELVAVQGFRCPQKTSKTTRDQDAGTASLAGLPLNKGLTLQARALSRTCCGSWAVHCPFLCRQQSLAHRSHQRGHPRALLA